MLATKKKRGNLKKEFHLDQYSELGTTPGNKPNKRYGEKSFREEIIKLYAEIIKLWKDENKWRVCYCHRSEDDII